MEQRVGTCSICGGDVMGHRGAWYGINPPPPDRCRNCGAVARSDVIKMYPHKSSSWTRLWPSDKTDAGPYWGNSGGCCDDDPDLIKIKYGAVKLNLPEIKMFPK